MSNVDLAKELVDIVAELEGADWGDKPERHMSAVKRKIEIINSLSNQMQDNEPKRDSFPEYGDAQGDLMEFIYQRFDGMPIAAIIGFLEMAKLGIIDESESKIDCDKSEPEYEYVMYHPTPGDSVYLAHKNKSIKQSDVMHLFVGRSLNDSGVFQHKASGNIFEESLSLVRKKIEM